MKDDLLIRFIDGNTSPEETELVFKELSQDGEAAKEWVQMVQGARLADTRPIMNIEPDDFIADTLTKKFAVQPEPRKVFRLPLLISGLATVAASLAILVAVMHRDDTIEMQQDVVADVEDTADAVIPETDDIVAKDVLDVKDMSGQKVADAVEYRVGEKADSQTILGESEIKPSQPEKQMDELAGRKILQEINTSTASQMEISSLEMIRPAKSPYRIRVKNPEKEFVFEWKMSNASNVRLSIADRDGRIIIDNEWSAEDSYGIVASDLVDRGELDWAVEVTFNDGTIQRKSGMIEFVSVKE